MSLRRGVGRVYCMADGALYVFGAHAARFCDLGIDAPGQFDAGIVQKETVVDGVFDEGVSERAAPETAFGHQTRENEVGRRQVVRGMKGRSKDLVIERIAAIQDRGVVQRVAKVRRRKGSFERLLAKHG